MTSQGSAHTRFRRAVQGGNPLIVTAACLELERVTLADALAVCLVYRDRDPDPDRFARAAARWHARYVSERRAGVGESQFVLACLTALADERCAEAAGEGLATLCERAGLDREQRVLEDWLRRRAA